MQSNTYHTHAHIEICFYHFSRWVVYTVAPQDEEETLQMAIQRIKDLERELRRAKRGADNGGDNDDEGDAKDDEGEDEPIKYPDGTAAPCLLNSPAWNHLYTMHNIPCIYIYTPKNDSWIPLWYIYIYISLSLLSLGDLRRRITHAS